MGGKLERATDEVAELVASRPTWMNGDPAAFNEEQLREYKEYCAKEQAAIEERLKRKAVMVSPCYLQPCVTFPVMLHSNNCGHTCLKSNAHHKSTACR